MTEIRFVDDKPPFPKKLHSPRRRADDLLTEGFFTISDEILPNPIICVIRWNLNQVTKEEKYTYAIFDLNGNDNAHPRLTGSNTDIAPLLDIAEDHKAFVMLYSKPFIRELERYTRPAALIDR